MINILQRANKIVFKKFKEINPARAMAVNIANPNMASCF